MQQLKPKRIGVFSGTFNPVHHGHIGFALEAISQCDLDKVVFIPEAEPRAKLNVAPVFQRANQLQDAIGSSLKFEVMLLKETQFTVRQTLPQLQKTFNKSQLYMLIGSDVVQNLHSWSNLSELLAVVTFIIGLRENDTEAWVKSVLQQLKMPVEFVVVKSPYPEMSSTKIRNH